MRYSGAAVDCLDVLTECPSWFRSGYAATYLFLVRYTPWIWRISYFLTDWLGIFLLVQPLRRRWNLLMARRFIQRLRSTPPDIVVATHFLPADICGAGKRAGWLSAPLIVVVTDFHPHRFWLSAKADALVVATAEGARTCAHRGITSGRVHVLGIPIAQPSPHKRAVSEQIYQTEGAAGRKTVLLTSGGTTVGPFERVVHALMEIEEKLPGRLKLIVVCGEDEAMAQRLQERTQKSAMPVRIFGFIDTMCELIAESNLVVAKAGGMTVAEVLGQGVPLVFYHHIPGQEYRNAQYIVRHGAAVIARNPRAVSQVVQRYLTDPQYAITLRQAAKQLSHPEAAEAIVSQVLAPFISHAAPPGA